MFKNIEEIRNINKIIQNKIYKILQIVNKVN